MSWTLLPTNYTDAVWSGLKKYNQIDNSDGTISLQDVTVYTNRERSFFGARDANRMNEALNYIMSMLENGTNLYEGFQTYFATQQGLFETAANGIITHVRTITDNDYIQFVAYLNSLKLESNTAIANIERTYQEHMTTYEDIQSGAFRDWFQSMRNQLSQDAAGSLQAQIEATNDMVFSRHIGTPLGTSFGETLAFSNGDVIHADLYFPSTDIERELHNEVQRLNADISALMAEIRLLKTVTQEQLIAIKED